MSDQPLIPGLPKPPPDDGSWRKPTGEYIAKHHPDSVRLILELWDNGKGCSLREIADRVPHSINTIRAVLVEHDVFNVDTLKADTRRNLAAANLRLSERMVDEADDIPAAQIALALKLSVETAANLGGEAAHVIEHRHQITGSVGLYSQLNDAHRMHSEAGNNSAMEPAAICAPAPIEAAFELVPAQPIGNLPPENTP